MYNHSTVFLKKSILVLTVVLLGLPGAARSQDASAPPIPIEEIIQKFAAKEKEFALARANYVYTQDVKVQELGARDSVVGEFHQTMEVGFDEKGRRTERIVYAPQPTLKRLGMTPEDLEDLRSIQPFVLTTDDIDKYKLKYVGKENVDEIGCYKFDVEPKKLVKGERYFQGSIWVDDRDFQIVKTYGKAVPDIRRNGQENLFPRFETYRQQIDDYWFPTYTRAQDTLQFETGNIKMRQIVRYEKYKRFAAEVKLTFGDEVDPSKDDSKSKDSGADKKASPLDPKYQTGPRSTPAPRTTPSPGR